MTVAVITFAIAELEAHIHDAIGLERSPQSEEGVGQISFWNV